MKKLVVLAIIISLYVVVFSGCVENGNLSQINENLGVAFSNINTHFYNYDFEYSWIILMNYVTFTQSMIDDMENYEDLINEEVTYIEDTIRDYQDSGDTSSSIDDKIDEFNLKKNKITSSVDSMETYRQFITMTRTKLILLENYEGKMSLMNLKVESGEFDDAVMYLDEMVDVMIDLKNNEYNRSELGIGEYTDELLSVWDLYLEAWSLYREYLLIEDETEASAKYTEYSNKYDEAYAIEMSENITEANDEIDSWYQENIAICIDIFE